jgi:hypothetical protein
MDKAPRGRHHAAMETKQLIFVVGVFAVAGGVKGVTGMGLPTVAMSLLGLWLAPVQATALLVAPSLATNVAQCRGPHLRFLARRLWPGWLAIVAVTVFMPGLEPAGVSSAANRWLGAVLVAYGVWGLWRPALPDLSRHGRWAATLAGAVTGVVTSHTSVFVVPWVPYLQSLRLDKEAMVQALGLSFTVATLALAVRLQVSQPAPAWSGSMGVAVWGALVGAFAGLKVGELWRAQLAGATFQKALFLVFVALGAANLVRPG